MFFSNFKFQICFPRNTFITWANIVGRKVYLHFRALVFLRSNTSSLTSSTQPSVWPHWPGFEATHVRSLSYWIGSSRRLLIWAFFSLMRYFFSIFFDRFFKNPLFLRSQLGPLPASQGQCLVGRVSFSVWCTISVTYIYDNTHNPCFAHTILGMPGEVSHIHPQGVVLLVPPCARSVRVWQGPAFMLAVGYPSPYFCFLW